VDKSDMLLTSRRDFTTTILSGCALCCLGSRHLLAAPPCEDPSGTQQSKHKFEELFEQKVTHKRLMQMRHGSYIRILKQFEKDVGRERALGMLKKASYEANVQLGRELSARIPSLQAFAGPFRDENSNLSKTIVREIIEDSETAFEIRVTECLTEVVFREADALDLGHACVCHADFGLPVGVHPRFRLTRTKTLMQGHDCCNHRYVWEK
jgi:hypothetical protein